MAIQTGLARVVKDGSSFLTDKRVGLICNPTAIDLEYRHASRPVRGAHDMKLAVLFGPEHGVRGDAQDMISVDTSKDPAHRVTRL